jgi:hypothetical protein
VHGPTLIDPNGGGKKNEKRGAAGNRSVDRITETTCAKPQNRLLWITD